MTPSEVGFDGKFEMFSTYDAKKKTIKLTKSNDINFEDSKNWNFQLLNTFLWINSDEPELLYRGKSGELFRVVFVPL
jgi:hypothetical protein